MGKDTKINLTLDFNAGNIQSAVDDIQKSLQKLSLPQGLNKNFLNLFSNLEAEVKNFGSLASKELTTAGDFSAVEKSGKKILDLYRKLGVEVDSLSDTDKMKLFPSNTVATINKINNAMKQFNSATDKNKKAIDAANKGVAKYSAEIKSLKEKQDAVRQKEVVDPVQFSKAQKDIKKYREEVEALQTELDSKKANTKARMEKDGRTSPDKRTKEYKAELAVQQQLETALKNLTDARTAANKITTETRQINELEKLKQAYDEAEFNLNSYREELKKLGDGGEAEAFKKMMESLKDVDGIDPSSIKSFKDLEEALQDIKTKAGDDVDEKIEEIVAAMRAAQGPADQFGDNMREAGDSIKEMSRDAQDLENLKHRILDFFSISNAVQLFKRAVKSAFDTVKELDATMTEAAVVTDFSVGDMWDKLPSYSGEASKLGATINDLYGATTLYYQQGLKTNEAMALGTETMKMARVAGMESAAATEAMTAALRGFNMELNETSATRVNDVYSELAAITAADTEQIATAMSKTASIASAANMEFESTAAFLSQIIETTQEAPETAGTALKTIIARFSEVKSLREKGLSSGEDSEGELIDVNKIQGALRTVGISMDEFFAGTEGLDSVLMKLASKWGTLDFETQRYIATTAAGSRQQSRFIAMMSNYDRTMELVGAANNSAGASQEQFNKTLESLDSKLNNLKNAWDEFVMGLANNELIKAGVDVLTSLLTTVNKIISSMSGGSGVVKTFVTAFAAIGAFKLGQKGLNKFLGNAAPKEGILAAILGKGKTGGAKTLGVGWGREAVDGFKDSFAKGAKDIFSGQKMTNFLFGNMGPIDTDSLKNSLATDLSKLSTDQTIIEPVKIKLNEGDLQGAAQQMRQIGIDAGYTDQQLSELGVNMDVINGAADGTIQKGQKMGKTLGQIGTYGAMAGAALMSMIPMLEEMGASDEVIAVIKGVAMALMALPVVMKIVEFATHAFAKSTTAAISSIPIIGWIAAAISALIALGSILATVIDTPEEKLKKAEQALDEATAAAQEAAEEYNTLKENLEEIRDFDDVFDGLVRGTEAWRDAIIENNQKVLELIGNYKELAPYVENQNGRLVLNEEKEINGKTVSDIQDDYANRALEQQRNANYASAVVEQKKYDITRDSELNKITAGSTYEFNIDYENYRMNTIASEAGYMKDGYIDSSFYDSEEYKAYSDKIQKGQVLANAGLMDSYGDGTLTISEQGKDIIEQLALDGVDNSNTDEVIGYLMHNARELGIEDFSEEEYTAFADYLSSLGMDFQDLSVALQTSTAALDAQNDMMASSAIEDFIIEQGIDTTTNEGAAQAAIYRDYATGDKYAELTESNEEELGRKPGNVEDYKQYVYDTYGKENVKKIKNDGTVVLADGRKFDGDTMKSTYASHLADEDIKEGAQGYADMVNNISNGNAAVGAVLSGQQGTQLTQSDLEDVLGGSVEEAIDATTGKIEVDEGSEFYKKIAAEYDKAYEQAEDKEEFEKLYGSREDFIQDAYDKLNNGAELFLSNAQHQKELIQQGAQIEESTTGLTASANEAVYGVYDQVAAQAGSEGVAEVSRNFEDFIDDVDKQDQSKVADIFGSIDWTQADAIEQFKQALEDAGLGAYIGTDSFNVLTQSLEKTTMAADAFDLSNVREQLKERLDLADEIKDNKTGTFDEATMKKLVDAGANREDFVWNGQEFVYIGGTMEDLSAAIESNTSELLANTAALLENKIKSGEEFGAGFDKLKESGWASEEYINKVMSGEEVIEESWQKKAWMGRMSEDGTITDSETGEKINISDLDGTADAAIIDRLWSQGLENYNNLTENKQQLIDTETAMAVGGRTADEVRAAGESEDLQIAASITEAQNAGLDTNEIINRADRIQEGLEGTDYKISEAMATELAKTEGIMNQGAKELSDGWDDITKALAPSNKGTLEYSNALEDLGKSTKKFLGISGDLSDKFLESAKSSGLLEKALKGDKKAFNDLQKEATKDILKKFLNESEEIPEHIEKMADEVADADLEIGATVEVDTDSMESDSLAYQLSSIYDQAYRSAIEGGQSVADAMAYANEVMAAEGFKAPEMEMKEVTITGDLPDGWQPQKDGSMLGPDGQPLTGVKWNSVEGEQYTYTQTMMVPKGSGNFTKTSEKIGNGSKKKGGGGGSKKSEKQVAKNPYDELYNTQQKVDETLRERNQLEREYDRLLENREVSVEKLLENQAKQLKNLREEYSLQKKIAKQELKDALDAKNYEYIATRKDGDKEEEFWSTFQKEADYYEIGDLEQYAKYNSETGKIDIDHAKLEAFEKDEEHGKDILDLIHEYISHIEEQSDAYEEANDRLEEIEDEIAEIKKKAMQDYLDFEQKIYDALVQQAQQEIDDMQTLSDTLSEENSSILESLRESIDLERQIRDNTKQEEDIFDMEARLAYLRRDTSGVNDLEIKQLEEQIRDARQSYGDSLIDQQLEKMSKDNEFAEEQRNEQIKIAQSQLKYWTDNGYFWESVDDLINDASQADELKNTKLAELLKETDAFKGMSYFGKKNWIYELAQEFALAGQGKSNFKVEEAEQAKKLKKGQVVDEKGKSVGALTYDEESKTWKGNGGSYSTLAWDEASGKYIVSDFVADKKEEPQAKQNPTPDPVVDTTQYYKKTSYKGSSIVDGLKSIGEDSSYENRKKIAKANSISNYKGSGEQNSKMLSLLKQGKLKKYKTGGLADFTGPAWLDGTKSKPEIVLSQQDSKNFIMLKDVLAEILQGATSAKSGQKSGGDNYFDISIIVDEISSDYDVDQMAARIKQQIYDDSTYRNVNAINLIR